MKNWKIVSWFLFGMIALLALAAGNFQWFMMAGAAASMAGYLEAGDSMFACVITPISKTNCPKCRAGIVCMWVAPCEAIEDLTFDANRCVVGITVDATHPDPTFKKIEFEKDTAFFNQAKTKVKNNTNVAQQVQFIEPCMTNEVKNALEDLNECCCLHAIIKDNSGTYHYAGISYNKDTDEWNDEDMSTGDGSANTGADPTADSNEFIETFNANTSWYAPHWKGGEAGIPV